MAVSYHFTIDEESVSLSETDEAICKHLYIECDPDKYCVTYQELAWLAVVCSNHGIDTINKYTKLCEPMFIKSLRQELYNVITVVRELNIALHIHR